LPTRRSSDLIAAQLSSLSVISQAKSLLEIGTGVGVSALALMRHLSGAHLTTLDVEVEYHRHAKQLFQEAGLAPAQFRLVAGDAHHVLPRFNVDSYDLVLIDGPKANLLEFLEHSLPLVKAGGTIIIPHALLGGKVADPAARDDTTTLVRYLLASIQESSTFVPALSPVGDGLLTLTRLPE